MSKLQNEKFHTHKSGIYIATARCSRKMRATAMPRSRGIRGNQILTSRFINILSAVDFLAVPAISNSPVLPPPLPSLPLHQCRVMRRAVCIISLASPCEKFLLAIIVSALASTSDDSYRFNRAPVKLPRYNVATKTVVHREALLGAPRVRAIESCLRRIASN